MPFIHALHDKVCSTRKRRVCRPGRAAQGQLERPDPFALDGEWVLAHPCGAARSANIQPGGLFVSLRAPSLAGVAAGDAALPKDEEGETDATGG